MNIPVCANASTRHQNIIQSAGEQASIRNAITFAKAISPFEKGLDGEIMPSTLCSLWEGGKGEKTILKL